MYTSDTNIIEQCFPEVFFIQKKIKKKDIQKRKTPFFNILKGLLNNRNIPKIVIHLSFCSFLVADYPRHHKILWLPY